MGSMSSLGQADQQTLQNNYLNPILKTQKLLILFPLFEIPLGKNFPNESCLFFSTLNVQIFRDWSLTTRKINETILKFSH